jgi:hypothetical protein
MIDTCTNTSIAQLVNIDILPHPILIDFTPSYRYAAYLYFRHVPVQNIGACQAEAGQCAELCVRDYGAMVDDFLKFVCCVAAVVEDEARCSSPYPAS